VKTNTTVSANTVKAPTGTTIASKLIENNVNGFHSISQTLVKAASVLTYTVSCFVVATDGIRTPYISVDDAAGNGATVDFNLDPSSENPPQPTTSGTGFTNMTVWPWYGGINLTDPNNPIQPNGPWNRIALTFTSTSTTTLNFTVGLMNAGAKS